MSHPRRQRHLWFAGRERGSAVIEAAIGVPAFMLFVGLIVFAGRVAIANQAVGSAATEAARSASISRTQAQAADTARAAATQALSNQKVNCLRMTISVDTSGFAFAGRHPRQRAGHRHLRGQPLRPGRARSPRHPNRVSEHVLAAGHLPRAVSRCTTRTPSSSARPAVSQAG